MISNARSILKKIESNEISVQEFINTTPINPEVLDLYILRNQITNYEIFRPFYKSLSRESRLKVANNLSIFDREIEKEQLMKNFKNLKELRSYAKKDGQEEKIFELNDKIRKFNKILIENFEDRQFLLQFFASKFREIDTEYLIQAIQSQYDFEYFFEPIVKSLDDTNARVYEKGVKVMNHLIRLQNKGGDLKTENSDEKNSSEVRNGLSNADLSDKYKVMNRISTLSIKDKATLSIPRVTEVKFLQDVLKKFQNDDYSCLESLPMLIISAPDAVINKYGERILLHLIPMSSDVIDSIGLLLLNRNIFLKSLKLLPRAHLLAKINLIYCYNQLVEAGFYINELVEKFIEEIIVKGDNKVLRGYMKSFLIRLYNVSGDIRLINVIHFYERC